MLHNHFFWENPRIFYLHAHRDGKAVELAQQLKPALGLIGHAPAATSTALTPTGRSSGKPVEVVGGKLALAELERIIGHKADTTGRVAQFTIGRDDLKVREMGAPINTVP